MSSSKLAYVFAQQREIAKRKIGINATVARKGSVVGSMVSGGSGNIQGR